MQNGCRMGARAARGALRQRGAGASVRLLPGSPALESPLPQASWAALIPILSKCLQQRAGNDDEIQGPPLRQRLGGAPLFLPLAAALPIVAVALCLYARLQHLGNGLAVGCDRDRRTGRCALVRGAARERRGAQRAAWGAATGCRMACFLNRTHRRPWQRRRPSWSPPRGWRCARPG